MCAQEICKESGEVFCRQFYKYPRLKINLLLLTKDIQEFCLEGKTCENAELPVKSCSALGNAGNEEMIVIQENSQQKLETLGNCIVISGQKESLIKLVDEFLFRLFKIKTE